MTVSRLESEAAAAVFRIQIQFEGCPGDRLAVVFAGIAGELLADCEDKEGTQLAALDALTEGMRRATNERKSE